jgi:hypothetical protein
MYHVIKNITGKLSAGTPAEEAVDITYYRGDSLLQAVSAMAQAAAEIERPDTLYRVNTVRLEVIA